MKTSVYLISELVYDTYKEDSEYYLLANKKNVLSVIRCDSDSVAYGSETVTVSLDNCRMHIPYSNIKLIMEENPTQPK